MAQRSSRSIGSRTPPSISRPIPQEPIVPAAPIPSSSKPSSPSTSPKQATRLHRPSISSTMNWLGRSVSSASISTLSHSQQPHAAPKPVRISEPQLKSAFERSGPLGAGATVVRTPQEALAGTRQDAISVRSFEMNIPEERYREHDDELAGSPPLPPLPLEDDEETIEAETRSVASRSSTPPRPSRPCPPPPAPEPEPLSEPTTPASLRPSLKVLDSFPPVPALPSNVSPDPLPPAFDAILLSGPLTGIVDPDKTLVTIETCTMTYKTTFATLTSRPSFLSSYLESILPPPPTAQSEDEESVYSRQSMMDSSFNSIFRHHLTTSGLIPSSTSVSTIHIFLDRPSAPYAHILSYLRTPVTAPEHPAVLPRAAQLTSSSSSRLEALLELREEARYLDLDELYRLCSDELRTRHYFGLSRSSQHIRGMSNASASTGSVRSLGTLRENDETLYSEESMKVKRLSRDSGNGSSESSSSGGRSRRTRSPANSIVAEVGWQSPPPAPVLEDRGRPGRKFSSMRMKPTANWI